MRLRLPLIFKSVRYISFYNITAKMVVISISYCKIEFKLDLLLTIVHETDTIHMAETLFVDFRQRSADNCQCGQMFVGHLSLG